MWKSDARKVGGMTQFPAKTLTNNADPVIPNKPKS